MRICIVSKWESLGGVEVQLADWVKFIYACEAKLDIDVVISLPDGKEEMLLSLLDPAIRDYVIVSPFKRIAGPMNRIRYFMDYFKQVDADIIIFAFACVTDFDFVEVMAAAYHSKKVVISFHTFIHYFLYPLHTWKFLFSKYRVGTLKDLIMRKFMGIFADTIYSCSHILKDEVTSFFSYLPADKFRVLYHGVDTKRFKPVDDVSKTKLKEKLGLNKDDVVFISTSRLARIKNIDKIIRAFHGLKCSDLGVSVKLLIVGSGEVKAELRKLVSMLALENDVLFVGLKYDVENFLRTSDVFVMASEGDAFGIALVEAMACGLFCIAVNRGGPSEILDTNCGYLIDSVQELPNAMRFAVNLLGDGPEKFKRICASARRRVEECFDKDRNIKEFVDHLIKR